MQTEYISKREVKVPDKAPQALTSLLVKTQEGLTTGGGLDTVRWLHDSLAFLTEFFASFAVGALQTVGPYSANVEKLLQQPHTLDRSERLLSQAFVDWKAHPHHPAYESLRETFYLSSRLQSSRFAPRRHTRWLGVEGRAVEGLERLTRWSRRIDLLVSGGDEETAQSFVNIYTPVLWTWTDALESFFSGWLVEVKTEVADGRLSMVGSASKDDVRLELVPVDKITGLKSRFMTDGNGGVLLDGFTTPSSLGAPSESLETEGPPAAQALTQAPEQESAPEASVEEDLQLSFDPASGDYVSAEGADPSEVPTPDGVSPESPSVEHELGAVTPEPVSPEAPTEDPVSSTPVSGQDFLAPPLFSASESTQGSQENPLFETSELQSASVDQGPPAPTDVPVFESPAVPEDAPVAEVPSFETPAVPEVAPVAEVPSFETPEVPEAATVAEVPSMETPAVPEVAPVAEVPSFETPAVPEAASVAEVPSVETPAVPEVAPVAEVPSFETPAVPEAATVAEVPSFETPAVPEVAPVAEVPSFETPEVPEAATVAEVPSMETPAVPEVAPVAEVPSFETPAVPEVAPIAEIPSFETPEVPETAPVAEVPSFETPAVPEAAPMADVPSFETPAVPEAAPVAEVPSLETPAVPEAAPEADVPSFETPSVPEAAPAAEIPSFEPPAVPEAATVAEVPSFETPSAPEAAPAAEIPSFEPPAVPEAATVAEVPSFETPSVPEAAPAAEIPSFEPPAVPEAATVAEVPSFETPSVPEAAPAAEIPSFEPPAVPEAGPVAEVPSLETPVVPEAAPEAEVPSFETPSVPEATPAAEIPSFEPPAVPEAAPAAEVPSLETPAVPEAAPEAEIPSFEPPAVPEAGPVAEVPSLETPVVPEAAPEAEVPSFETPSVPEATPAAEIPSFEPPAVPEVASVAEVPSLETPAVPEAAPAAEVPSFEPPAAPEATPAAVEVPSFEPPAVPEAAPVAAEVPSFEPPAVPEDAPVPEEVPGFDPPAVPEAAPAAEIPSFEPPPGIPEATPVSAEVPSFEPPAVPETTPVSAEVPSFEPPAAPETTPAAAEVPSFEPPAAPEAASESLEQESPSSETPAVPEAELPSFEPPAGQEAPSPADVPGVETSLPPAGEDSPTAPEVAPALESQESTAADLQATSTSDEAPSAEPSTESGVHPAVVAGVVAAGAAAVAAATSAPEAEASQEGVVVPPETVEVPIADLQAEPPSSEGEAPVPEQTVEIPTTPTPPDFEGTPPAAPDDMFAVSDDMFSTTGDASAPLFPVDNVETGVSGSPFVAPVDPEFHSVELDTSVASAREMGASAEEILDDGYQFSAEDGPAAPQWKGWSVDQREAVQEVCEFVVGQSESRMPTVFSTPIYEALGAGHQKIQVLLEPNCGKSRLAQDITLAESASESHLVLLANWEFTESDQQAGSELLAFFNELRRSKRAQAGQLVLPEPETVTALATAADRDGFSQAFQRLVGQVASLNKKPVLFILDQPPELVCQALAAPLSGSARVLSFVSPTRSIPELGHMVDLRGQWKQAATELFGETARNYYDYNDATLLRLALATEMVNGDLKVPVSMADVEETVLDTELVSEELVAVLSLEKEPISLDDLDQWFLDADLVTETITAFPSLFKLTKTRLSPVLGLAHPSVAQLVGSKFSSRRSNVARKLLGWVVAQLEKTNAEKYGGLQVREIVFRTFLRLYRYAKLSNDLSILEWVLRNKDLQRRRVALTGHLERPGSRYELQELNQLLVELLTELVDSGNCDDLRDELAWALSNLALNQLRLGLLPQASENVSLAVELFETLVTKERQYEFRPGLSTTHYRASRIFEALGEQEAAVSHANDSVQGFVDLVEDRGRAELAPRLGIALAHRGSLACEAGDSASAKRDLQRAATLLGTPGESEPRETYRALIDIQLELVSIFTTEGDLENAVRESGKAVQLATVAVEERGFDGFQPLLATCHGVRAKSYAKSGQADRAHRDIAKSISLRNLSVDEGRLEQRFYLAKDLQLRAQIDQGRGAQEDAARDLGRAIELLHKLQSEGRSDAAPQLLKCLQDRAQIKLATGEVESAVEDLNAANQLLGDDGAPGVAEQRLQLMDRLLQAYLLMGNSAEVLSISQGLLSRYHQAQAWEPFSRIQLVRGEAFERSGDLKSALDSYNQAANLLGQLLSQGQTDELLGKVAEAYLGVGGVEFKLGRTEASLAQVTRAVEVFTHLFQQRSKPGALPRMLKAYCLMAAGHLSNEATEPAKQAIKNGFDILGYMDSSGGKGGVPTSAGLESQKGELHRQRARVLLQEGDAGNAYNDSEEAIRNYLATRQGSSGAWKDELARTWILRSRILFALKDFGQAEGSIQDAIQHFEERLREARYEFFSDLMIALSTRAEHSARSGKIDQVLEEYNKMLSITTSVAQAGATIDHEFEMAKIFEKRAQVYRDQNLLNQAYADYENVIGLMRKLVTELGRADLASELTRVHIERGEMTVRAGHAEHSVNDFTEAVNVASALVGQGQVSAVPSLARALHSRAEVFRALGRGQEALQDLQGSVGFRMQLVQTDQSPETMGALGKSLLAQGTLLVAAGQIPQAAASLDQANGIFTDLVEKRGLKDFSSELAQGLIQRVSLSQDKSNPALRNVLIKAVNLVNQQAKDGKPVGKDFSIECLRTVVELLQREDFDTVGDLIDSVLSLVETVVSDGKSEQDFVKLTDLLLAASAGLIDDRRTARRPHFLSLACVSCNREIQMFGKNSLPRLVYCLYELGQALERSKPPTVLNYVGSSFALLGELAVQQQTNEDFLRELKMMVSTWRSLPPQIPALANVSRHMLSQLLRLT